jgi:hypothetical protein
MEEGRGKMEAKEKKSKDDSPQRHREHRGIHFFLWREIPPNENRFTASRTYSVGNPVNKRIYTTQYSAPND